jgi:hypothetical protein
MRNGKHVVAVVCGYELVALYSGGKIPTLSRLSCRYRWLGPVLVGGLTLHLYRFRRTVQAA